MKATLQPKLQIVTQQVADGTWFSYYEGYEKQKWSYHGYGNSQAAAEAALEKNWKNAVLVKEANRILDGRIPRNSGLNGSNRGQVLKWRDQAKKEELRSAGNAVTGYTQVKRGPKPAAKKPAITIVNLVGWAVAMVPIIYLVGHGRTW